MTPRHAEELILGFRYRLEAREITQIEFNKHRDHILKQVNNDPYRIYDNPARRDQT